MINEIIDAERTFSSEMAKIREYALGKQTNGLTAGQKTALEGLLGCDFADNICALILDTNTNRLRFLGWEVVGKQSQSFADDIYSSYYLSALSNDVHYSMLRDGNSALLVVPDDGKLQFIREDWWNGYYGMFVGYDKNHKKAYAVREWVNEEGIKRRIIWLAGRIERYFFSVNSSIWLPFSNSTVSASDEWVNVNNEPLSIPVVHFGNRKRVGMYGLSELSGGLLAFQDQINGVQYDASICGRFTGYQQYYVAGVEIKYDKSGNPVSPLNSPGVWHVTDNQDAVYGTLPAGDISKLKELYLMKLQSMCRVAQTPMHYITGGDFPAGEAIHALERPFTSKLVAQISRVKPAWEEVLMVASQITGLTKRTSKITKCAALFDNPEKRDVMTEALAQKAVWEAASLALSAGIPLTTFLKSIGWSNEQIDEMMREQAEDPFIQAKQREMINSPVNPLLTSPANNILNERNGRDDGTNTRTTGVTRRASE